MQTEKPRNKGGRPKGSRNKSTIAKELAMNKILDKASSYLVHEVPGILEAMVKKARGGDTTAAKLILERAMPATGAREMAGKNLAIQINIRPSEVTHGEATAVGTEGEPDGQAGTGSESFQVLSFDGSAERT